MSSYQYDMVMYWLITWSKYGDNYIDTEYTEKLRHPWERKYGYEYTLN